MPISPTISPAELAERLGMSERTLRKKAREFRTCRILGRTMFLLPEDVEALMARLAVHNVALDKEIKAELAKEKRGLFTFYEPRKIGFVYYIATDDGRVKIGHAIDVQRRLNALRTSCPRPLTLLAKRRGSQKLERELHRQFAEDRLQGEWFRLSDAIRAHIDSLSTC